MAVVATLSKGYDYIWKPVDRRPRMRPATTSRPARAGESRPAAGGAPAPKRSASSMARPSSANRTTCCRRVRSPDGTPLGSPGQRPERRRAVCRATGRRTARYRRTPTRTADQSRQACPPNRYLKLARPAGFEPATRCLEGTSGGCLEVAPRRLTWVLAASMVADNGSASPENCQRWLPAWLPGCN